MDTITIAPDQINRSILLSKFGEEGTKRDVNKFVGIFALANIPDAKTSAPPKEREDLLRHSALLSHLATKITRWHTEAVPAGRADDDLIAVLLYCTSGVSGRQIFQARDEAAQELLFLFAPRAGF